MINSFPGDTTIPFVRYIVLVRSCKHDFPHQVKSDESKSVTPETEEVREDKAKQCTISTKMS